MIPALLLWGLCAIAVFHQILTAPTVKDSRLQDRIRWAAGGHDGKGRIHLGRSTFSVGTQGGKRTLKERRSLPRIGGFGEATNGF